MAIEQTDVEVAVLEKEVKIICPTCKHTQSTPFTVDENEIRRRVDAFGNAHKPTCPGKPTMHIVISDKHGQTLHTIEFTRENGQTHERDISGVATIPDAVKKLIRDGVEKGTYAGQHGEYHWRKA
jgi:hypothetical protein